jgi:transposase
MTIKENVDVICPEVLPAETKKKGRGKQRKEVTYSKKIAKILELKANNLPIRDIAKASHLAPNTVLKYLKRFETIAADLKDVDAFRIKRGDIVDAAQAKILQSMLRQDKLDSANLRDHAYAAKELYAISRTEHGLASKITESRALNFTRIQLDEISSKPKE